MNLEGVISAVKNTITNPSLGGIVFLVILIGLTAIADYGTGFTHHYDVRSQLRELNQLEKAAQSDSAALRRIDSLRAGILDRMERRQSQMSSDRLWWWQLFFASMLPLVALSVFLSLYLSEFPGEGASEKEPQTREDSEEESSEEKSSEGDISNGEGPNGEDPNREDSDEASSDRKNSDRENSEGENYGVFFLVSGGFLFLADGVVFLLPTPPGFGAVALLPLFVSGLGVVVILTGLHIAPGTSTNLNSEGG